MIASRRLGRLHRPGVSLLSLLRLVGVLLVLLGCSGEGNEAPPAPQSTAPNAPTLDTRVFPAAALPFGQGYAAWSAEWWQWAVSLPVPENPIFDETGQKCAIAQRGAVWFLAGVLSQSGMALRRCASMPADTALFFPLVVEWDHVQIAPPLTVEALRHLTSSLIGGIAELAVELDGVPLQNVQLLRFTSPAFTITLPQNNLFQALGNPAGAPGIYFPTVVEGVYVMLKPLAVGEHTLRLRGQGRSSALDITYQLTVVPLILP